MQDTGEFETCYVIYREIRMLLIGLMCSFTHQLFSLVVKDIDSDRPMMQVGQYVFAGEYEGKNQSCKVQQKIIYTACTCCLAPVRKVTHAGVFDLEV